MSALQHTPSLSSSPTDLPVDPASMLLPVVFCSRPRFGPSLPFFGLTAMFTAAPAPSPAHPRLQTPTGVQLRFLLRLRHQLRFLL